MEVEKAVAKMDYSTTQSAKNEKATVVLHKAVLVMFRRVSGSQREGTTQLSAFNRTKDGRAKQVSEDGRASGGGLGMGISTRRPVSHKTAGTNHMRCAN
uniref:Uncharacterized protein n=1 Tax=Glossina austeni TaxID=7395 RepID=A0A1A9UFY4_GLOAU